MFYADAKKLVLCVMRRAYRTQFPRLFFDCVLTYGVGPLLQTIYMLPENLRLLRWTKVLLENLLRFPESLT